MNRQTTFADKKNGGNARRFYWSVLADQGSNHKMIIW